MKQLDMLLVRINYTHKHLDESVHYNDFVVPDIETAISLINQDYTTQKGGMVSIVDLVTTLSVQSLEILPKDLTGINLSTVHKMYAHITETKVYLEA